jgi:hypothetical protein
MFQNYKLNQLPIYLRPVATLGVSADMAMWEDYRKPSSLGSERAKKQLSQLNH